MSNGCPRQVEQILLLPSRANWGPGKGFVLEISVREG